MRYSITLVEDGITLTGGLGCLGRVAPRTDTVEAAMCVHAHLV